MNAATVGALAAINRRFYDEQAQAFHATRTAPWPGWERLLPGLRDAAARGPLRVLDVGCGNGRFARYLAERLPGAALDYRGVDASAPLLALARGAGPAGAGWQRLDAAAEPDALPAGPFELVALIALLHGVPGRARRAALLDACARRVAPAGRLVLTSWRVAADPRARGRLLPPEAFAARAGVALDPAELEPGDAGLPWGESDTALRYVHDCDAGELAETVARLPLPLEQRYRADGAGGDRNEYLVFRAAPAPL